MSMKGVETSRKSGSIRRELGEGNPVQKDKVVQVITPQ
jgi:hypothetical protein